MSTDAEQTMINALHEAWHCAAAFEKQQPVNRIHLWPYPGTGWGDPDNDPADDFTRAVITLVPNIAMPEWPSDTDKSVLDELSPGEVERARPEATRLVDEVIDRSGVAAIARNALPLGFLSGSSAKRVYDAAKRTVSS
jgi:hypothetical protein